MATAVVLVVAVLARLGLLALGRSFVGALESQPLGGVAVDVAIVVGSLSISVAALRFAASRRLGWLPALPALAAVALLGARGWKGTLREPRYHDFHGVWTQSPSQSWTENRPHLPPVTYRHDREGFRGPGFDLNKAPGRLRVALVGDSFIFGKGVEENQTLKARIDQELGRRGLGDKVEVLNLGIPGANMATHVRMYTLAHELLGADVIVMGLFEDNDLAEWDVQDEINQLPRFSPFSLGCYLLGERPSVVLATVLTQMSEASSVASFGRIEATLAAIREHDGAPPLIILDYFSHHDEIRARFASRPNVSFIATAERGRPPREYHIPNDGHPSAAGNEVFAGLVTERLLAVPAIAALASPPP